MEDNLFTYLQNEFGITPEDYQLKEIIEIIKEK
jgi:hypothetical protein